MVKVSMHSLSSGKRAYLTTQLQNEVFTPEKAAEYAKNQWDDDVDIGSIDAYMQGEPDPLSPAAKVSVAELPEIGVSLALSRNLGAVEEGLTLVEHQYQLNSGKRIDILCKDKAGQWVIVEVKKAATRDVIDQLLGYMSELKSSYPEDEVRGIVMSSSYDADLASKLGLLKGSGIELRYYKLSVLPASEKDIKEGL